MQQLACVKPYPVWQAQSPDVWQPYLCDRRNRQVYDKKGQHRRCHTAKCNMLNKWLKNTSILVTHTLTFTTIHLKYVLFTQICTNISHTRTTTYAHMHICNRPPKRGKIKCCHLANIEYFLSLVMFRLSLRVLPPGEYLVVIHTPMP